MTSRIRWGRVVAAAVMSDAGVIALLLAVTTIYMSMTPGLTDDQYYAKGEDIGYYVAPTAGAVLTALSALWAARRLTSAFVLHGVLVGVVATLLTIGFIFGARPDHRVMYVVSFGLKIAGGYVGGLVAQWRYRGTSNRTCPTPT